MLKQSLVVRTDLKMSKGKLAAQVAHAAVGAFLEAPEKWRKQWLAEGMKKVVLKVKDLQELMQIYRQAKDLGLPVFLVVDAGRTELAPGTVTCVGIGPAPEEEVDKVTGHLHLL
ncbi:MAG: peptidyl-tRNA hydrolase [bacterium]|nr:peptidyl-tRNA hydrolase [bacterium]